MNKETNEHPIKICPKCGWVNSVANHVNLSSGNPFEKDYGTAEFERTGYCPRDGNVLVEKTVVIDL